MLNAINGRIKSFASKEIILSLISAKCIFRVIYASEVLRFNSAQLKSINFSAKRVLFKIFKTASPISFHSAKNFSIFLILLN